MKRVGYLVCLSEEADMNAVNMLDAYMNHRIDCDLNYIIRFEHFKEVVFHYECF